MKTLDSKQINEVYLERGLRGIYSLLKNNGIEFKKNVIEFGLNTNKQAKMDYSKFVDHSNLRFHYFSRGVKSRKTGYSYNVIRGIELIITQL